MNTDRQPDLSAVGTALGHPARAAMLMALLGGTSLPAGELAARARVAPSTASEHLARLVGSGLVTTRRAGRHRYYALAGPEVAAGLEALLRVAPAAAPEPPAAPALRALRFARTCYDHLAGTLGVRLADALLEQGMVSAHGYDLTAQGEGWLGSLDIDVAELRRRRRRLAQPCLDWTERRDHVAGAVGAAIASTFLQRGWVVRLDGTRALRWTVRGSEGLYRSLGIRIDPPV
jgi:DNA-binding transcriptional ArsR family regulator